MNRDVERRAAVLLAMARGGCDDPEGEDTVGRLATEAIRAEFRDSMVAVGIPEDAIGRWLDGSFAADLICEKACELQNNVRACLVDLAEKAVKGMKVKNRESP